MADFTPNYNLKKPLRTEYYNVADANGNSDIIDTQLKAVNDRVDLVEGEVDALESGKVDKVVGKQLSDENYTLIEKNKVANLPDDTNAQLAEKANKVQEAWITPTLLNGWTHITGKELQFRKDEFGIVRLRGGVTGGTLGQPVFNLPVGYRVSKESAYLSRCQSPTPASVIVSPLNSLYIYAQATNVQLDNITYSAS